MSMRDYEAARDIILAHPERNYLAGPRPPYIVDAAETALGVIFPPTYRRFLLEFGAGGFGAYDFYGIVRGGLETASAPNGIWFTLKLRRECALPENLIKIYNVGDGEMFFLETQSGGSEGPVIVYVPELLPDEQPPREEIAPDFGAFLLHIVRVELGECEL